jgi:hypothetical protein
VIPASLSLVPEVVDAVVDALSVAGPWLTSGAALLAAVALAVVVLRPRPVLRGRASRSRATGAVAPVTAWAPGPSAGAYGARAPPAPLV